jgi:hypothetical protein
MKHFLRTFFLLTLVGYSAFGHAQTGSCSVTQLIVQNVRPVEGEACTYTFDVAFTITSQSSKLVFFQSYIETNPLIPNNPYEYPDYWRCREGVQTRDNNGTVDPPTSTTVPSVGRPFLNVAIDNSGATPVFTNYLPDPAVQIRGIYPRQIDPISGAVTDSGTLVTSFELPDGNTRFNLTGLRIQLEPELCGQPFVVITDFFATNANVGNSNNPNIPIQCVSCGVRFAVGFFNTVGTVNCNTREIAITLTNNTVDNIELEYQLFADVNRNGIYTPGVDVLVSGPVPLEFTLDGGIGNTETINVGLLLVDYLEYDLLFVSTIATGFGAGAQAATVLNTDCISGAPLPVKFKSFNANRKNRDVVLTWETASEDNNRGFYVQRNNGGGWKDLGFVATKAQGGNSTSDLSYTYTDLNNTTRGVTQYRIMQVDIDGKSKLSDVRQVRGLDQAGKVTVYPNPSIDGKVNVVFDDSKAAWNVSVSDMNGRKIKQYKGVTNSVVIDNLVPGMYIIRIVEVQTGVQTNEKVIINNR